MLLRKKYINWISKFIDSEEIKIITGIRRSGKTEILKQLREKIYRLGVSKENVIYINLESMKHISHRDSINFYKYVCSLVNTDEKYYLLFDEIQLVDRFEEAINSFRVDFNCSIFVTGSNADLLSGELATLLSGRYIHFKVYPFTYKEYCAYLDIVPKDEKHFWDYVLLGGMPQTIKTKDVDMKQAQLVDILSSIVYKDIILRSETKSMSVLNSLVDYVVSQTGTVFSAKSIVNYLRSININTNTDTVYNYINAIINSHLVSKCSRYNIKGKKILARQEKYYCADLGLINHMFNSTKIDKGASIETIVYNQLKYHGYDVYIGKVDDYEVDFVARKFDKLKYLQVCYKIDSETTRERELRSLECIRDNFPKYIISMDYHFVTRNGIEFMNLLDFLVLDVF